MSLEAAFTQLVFTLVKPTRLKCFQSKIDSDSVLSITSNFIHLQRSVKHFTPQNCILNKLEILRMQKKKNILWSECKIDVIALHMMDICFIFRKTSLGEASDIRLAIKIFWGAFKLQNQ